MELRDIFLNQAGRLRSGWRLCVYALGVQLAFAVLGAILSLLPFSAARYILESRWGYVAQALVLLIPALLAGWVCGKFLEELPPRALGLAFTRRWLRDLFYGTLVGAASLLLATGIAAVFGGLRFTLDAPLVFETVGRTVLTSIPIFILSAAGEEAMFRGYALQTMTRSHLAWVAIIITSVIFSSGHLENPNVVPGFTFVNTALAGVWLAIAYLKTRNLWFPLGVHWAWNWTMSAILGIPVSGITSLTPDPLLRATDFGPAWLTGGSYGLEGGAACTIALLLSTVFIWRTRLVSATDEMMRLTNQENPITEPKPLTIS